MLVGDEVTILLEKRAFGLRLSPLPLRHSAGIEPDFPRFQPRHDSEVFSIDAILPPKFRA
jgi:hypothetical protein